MSANLPSGDADQIVYLAEALDVCGEAVIATDLAGSIVYWSQGAEDLYGWTASEVIGRDVVDITPSDLSREDAERIMDELRRGMSWHGSFRVRTKGGDSLLAQVRDVPVRGSMGELIGVIGVSSPLHAGDTVRDPRRGGVAQPPDLA